MMPRTCTVCAHPNRNGIETEVQNKTPYRNITEQFSVTSSAICRHTKRAHIVATTALTLVPIVAPPVAQNTQKDSEFLGKLTGKQARFVAYYVGEARSNGTQAARLAGYGGEDNSLATRAWDLLRNVEVQRAIESRLKVLHGSGDHFIAELNTIALAPLSDFLKLTTKEGTIVNVKLELKDKLKALEMSIKCLSGASDEHAILLRCAREGLPRLCAAFPHVPPEEMADYFIETFFPMLSRDEILGNTSQTR